MIFVLLTFGGWNEAAYLVGRGARRAAQHDPHPGRRHPGRDGALPAGERRLPRRARPGRHEGVEGRRGRRRCALVAGDKGAVADRADRLRLRAHHHERRDLHRRAHHLRARTRFPRSSASSAPGARRAARRPTRCCCRARSRWSLVVASAMTPDGFSAMVAYTSPVFWTFFLLTGADAVRLQAKSNQQRRRSACRSTRWCRSRSASPASTCSIRASTTCAFARSEVRRRGARRPDRSWRSAFRCTFFARNR